MAESCSKFILIGRNKSKLNDVEKELKSIRNDVVIEQKVIDFSTFEDYSGLRQVFIPYVFSSAKLENSGQNDFKPLIELI